MRHWILRSVLLCSFLLAATSSWAEVTRDQLLEMVENDVDVELIVAVIQRECVDFEVTGSNLTELAGLLPKEVLGAALECRDHPRSLDSPVPANSDDPTLCEHLSRVFDARRVHEKADGAISEPFDGIKAGLDVSWASTFQRYRTTAPYPKALETGIRINEDPADYFYYRLVEGKEPVQAAFADVVDSVEECLGIIPIWNDDADRYYSGNDWEQAQVGEKRWSGVDFKPPADEGHDADGGIMVRRVKRDRFLEIIVYAAATE
jgi:hypothetical protein